MTCEDYPCCGHTDGLGCDWVSPNEVVPCDTCIQARAYYPYHNRVDGCPTERAQATANIPAGAECEWAEGDPDCEVDAAYRVEYNGRIIYVCADCARRNDEADAEMRDMYDSYY